MGKKINHSKANDFHYVCNFFLYFSFPRMWVFIKCYFFCCRCFLTVLLPHRESWGKKYKNGIISHRHGDTIHDDLRNCERLQHSNHNFILVYYSTIRASILSRFSFACPYHCTYVFARFIFSFNGEQICKRLKIRSLKSRRRYSSIAFSTIYKVNFKHFYSHTQTRIHTHRLAHSVTHSNKMK